VLVRKAVEGDHLAPVTFDKPCRLVETVTPAPRLEPLAKPDGLLLGRGVRDLLELQSRLDLAALGILGAVLIVG